MSQGETDFGLIHSLKYWRSRFFLLPTNQSATKTIQLSSTKYCDIYDDRITEDEEKRRLETFTRFLAMVNRLRRQPQKATSSSSTAAAASSRLQLVNRVPSRRTSPSNHWQVQSARFSTTTQSSLPVVKDPRASRRSSSIEAPVMAVLAQLDAGGNNSNNNNNNGTFAVTKLQGRGASLPSPRSQCKLANRPSEETIAAAASRKLTGSGNDGANTQHLDIRTASPTIKLTTDDHNDNNNNHFLHMHSPLAEILATMKSSVDGLPFLVSKPAPNLPELPERCVFLEVATHLYKRSICRSVRAMFVKIVDPALIHDGKPLLFTSCLQFMISFIFQMLRFLRGHSLDAKQDRRRADDQPVRRSASENDRRRPHLPRFRLFRISFHVWLLFLLYR